MADNSLFRLLLPDPAAAPPNCEANWAHLIAKLMHCASGRPDTEPDDPFPPPLPAPVVAEPPAVVEDCEPEPLARALADHSRLPDILDQWATTLPPGESASRLEPPFELATKRDVAAAEQILLKGLVKPEDGFLTRHISRKISLAVTRRLAATPVTPNAMTFFCLALGLAAAWCFGSPVAESQLTGGLFFLLHSILDGCDGELARLKFKESRLGGVLDFWSDNVVHVAVFSALAYAWSAAVDDDWPLLLGAAAVSGTILSAGFVYLYAMRPRQDGRPLLTTVSPSYQSRLTEVLDAAARRDFIYLVMIFSLFGKAYWFVAAAAAGAPVFFVSMVIVALGNGRQRVPAESPAVS